MNKLLLALAALALTLAPSVTADEPKKADAKELVKTVDRWE